MGRSQPFQQSIPTFWRLLRRFWPNIRKQWKLLIISAIALGAEVVLRLLEPWPLKFVFDYVLIAGADDRRSGLPLIQTLDPVILLTLAALSLVAITGLRAFASYWNTVSLASMGSRVTAEVRNQLYRHIQSLSLSYHTKAKSGDLLVRVNSDVNRLQEVLLTAVMPLVVSLLNLVSMVGMMFWLNRELALLALVTFPLFWLETTRLSQLIRQSAKQQRQRIGEVAATAAEGIGAIKVVQALSLQESFAQVFSRHNQKSLKKGVQTKRLAANLQRTIDVVMASGTALVLWYGSRLVLQNALSAGDVLVFLTYLRNAFRPVQKFAKYASRLAQAAASAERVLDILDETPDVRDLPGVVSAPTFQGAVRLDRVSFAYEPVHNILKDIQLEVQPGQQVALVGASGSGKSTLVSLLLRLYDPIAGRVMIDGRDIRKYTLASLRSQISVVLQDSLLFAATVWENIAYGVPDATRQDIEAAAQLANAHTFIEALPQGYNTILGERGATLSGGQRQRLAIARAAIRNTPILILDEPTTGLDKQNEHMVMAALEQLAQNRTTFMITHNLHMATHADVILYLEDGQVLEQGTHSELMQLNGRYAALYQMQIAVRDRNHDAEESGVAIS
ncbi:MAG: ABC transporter ATP-binding protein [Leptolyngbyaceae cyanobacterium MO_188.B28]|nr:ABC transporter ATP-binding protein [Leptolyngbyaceae cyanobacterium MO_188.B28]